MAVGTDTVRSGTSFLAGVMTAVAGRNRKLSPEEVKGFTQYGDSLDKAVSAVHAYAQNRYKVRSPSVEQLNRSLGVAMKMIARAAGTGRDGKQLSKPEFAGLAFTWQQIVNASSDFKGWSVKDVIGS